MTKSFLTKFLNRGLALLLVAITVISLIPASVQEVKAAENITINGIDIGYADGNYFTKSGKSCKNNYWSNGRCHKNGVCTAATHSQCNCLRIVTVNGKKIDLCATQCFGFARYCQLIVYGTFDALTPSKFRTIAGITSVTANNIRAALQDAAPGTHVRTKTTKKEYGHSFVIISVSSTGVIICEANKDGYCRISTASYTWQGLANYLNSYGGMDYATSYKNYTPNPSTETSELNVPILAYNFSSNTKTPVYSSPSTIGKTQIGSIFVGDKCEILSVSISGRYVQVKYPVTNGFKIGYTYLEHFFPSFPNINYTAYNATITQSSKVFRKADMAVHFGDVISGESVLVVGDSGTGLLQIVYKVDGTTQYKTGWIRKSSVQKVCNHTSTELRNAVAATCTNAGYTGDKYCKECSVKLSGGSTIPKKAHTPGSAASCSAPQRCTVCNTTLTVALGHKYTAKVTAPTCQSQGYTTHTCTRCSSSYKDNYTNALGHNYDSGTVTVAPTESSTGVKKYTCTRCKLTKTETLPVLEHTHKYTDTIIAPTCSAKGYTKHTCSCGYSYSDTYKNALGHNYGTWNTIKNPTCTESGTERRYCANCNLYETRNIDPKGHTEVTDAAIAATCLNNGKTAGSHCAVCKKITVDQKIIPATGHNYSSWTASKEPTTYSEGIEVRSCKKCDHKETRTIAKLPAPTTSCTITVGSVTAHTDSEIRVPVSVNNNNGISLLCVTPEFDNSRLELIRVENGSAFQYLQFAKNIILSSDKNIVGTNRDICYLVFKLKDNSNTADIKISLIVREAYNEQSGNVSVISNPGQITVPDVVDHDYDGNGIVNGRDLVLLIRYISEFDYNTGSSTIEINKMASTRGTNVQLCGKDVILLQQYLSLKHYEN